MSVDDFVEDYWPPIHRYDYSRELGPQIEAFRETLKERFGAELVDKALEFGERVSKGFCPKTMREADEFMLGKNMDLEFNPPISLRAKRTLHYLLNYFQGRDSFSVLDLGTGSGQIAVGIAKYFPQAQVTTIDYVKSSVTSVNALAEEHGVTNIEATYGDYSEVELPRADVNLALYTTDPHQAMTTLSDLRGERIFGLAGNGPFTESLFSMISQQVSYFSSLYGLCSEIIHSDTFIPIETLFLASLENRE